jgi:hypothetical protein
VDFSPALHPLGNVMRRWRTIPYENAFSEYTAGEFKNTAHSVLEFVDLQA